MSEPAFNPLDPAHLRDPYPGYRLLRDQRAAYVDALGLWFVGRYDDIRHMATHPEVFSNKKFEQISKGEFTPVPEARSLISSDPPEHVRIRKLASQAFRPPRVRALEEKISEIVDRVLDEATSSGESFDFQIDVADRLPMEVTCHMFGVGLERAPDFKRWTSDMLSSGMRSTMNEAQLQQIRESIAEARQYFGDLIELRRRNRGEDMISAFINAEEEGDFLTAPDILGLSILLLLGGVETTAHLVGNTIVTLWKNPDQLQLVLDNPALIPKLVEEGLRFEPPVQLGWFNNLTEVDLGDEVVIPEDSHVVVVWGSANRDPDHFKDPDRFDILRERNEHMTFGFGGHVCLGNALARLQGKVILRAVFERLPDLKPRLPDQQLDWIPSFWIRGLNTLPVVA